MAFVLCRLSRCSIVPLLAFVLAPLVAHAQVDHLDSLRARIVELYQSGKYSEAIPVAQQALALTQKRSPPGHAAVGVALDNLAVLYITQGRFAEAEPLSKRAVAIFEKTLAGDDSHLGIALDNLASILTVQARYAEVEPLRKRALAIAERRLGANNPGLGPYLTNLADLYSRQRRYAEAEPLSRRALQSGERLGSEHPTVALRLSNLAWLLKEQKRYDDAQGANGILFSKILGCEAGSPSIPLGPRGLCGACVERRSQIKPGRHWHKFFLLYGNEEGVALRELRSAPPSSPEEPLPPMSVYARCANRPGSRTVVGP